MLQLIAALLLSALFLLAGVNHIKDFNGTVDAVAKAMPIDLNNTLFYQLLTIAVIALEILAPVALVYIAISKRNKSLGYLSALALALVAISTILIYYYPPTEANMQMFLMNLAIVGGLLALARSYEC